MVHEHRALCGRARLVEPHFEGLIEEILCGELVFHIGVLVDVVVDVVVGQYWLGKALEFSFMEVVEEVCDVWVLIGILRGRGHGRGGRKGR